MLEIESLLTPLAEDAPSGSDLEYDAAFLALEAAGAGKPEQQYGETVIPAEPPDWQLVQQLAAGLATRTRDLRLAVWLARCGARLEGFGGASAGLQLVHGLLRDRWPDVHPQLDATDGNDPTMRMNALLPLVSAGAFLADLRSAALTSARGSITVREIELGLGMAEPDGGEPVPTPAGVLDAMRQALAQDPALSEVLEGGCRAAQGIAQVLDEQLGGAVGPDLQPLLRVMRAIDLARQRAGGGDEAAEANRDGSQGLPGPVAGGVHGPISSRADVVRTLDQLCDWIERNEPSNPAPLLLRRAQRLMSMSFMDIVRDLVPESIGQVERLAGIQPGSE